jgi:urease accessory protein
LTPPRTEEIHAVPFRLFIVCAFALTILGSADAHAHETGVAGGALSGFLHPIMGWDHVAALIAVGLWGAVLERPGVFVLPVVFPIIMAAGAGLGMAGIPIPPVEVGIAASSLVLGLLIAFTVRCRVWIAAVIVGAFAVFHGYAHGAELPAAANPIAYAAGFVAATACLHMAGIALSLATVLPNGMAIVRTGGGVIALAGAVFLGAV